MVILKCKMCGGTLEVLSGESVAICDSCGSKQTVPTGADERISNLFGRANHLRLANEFDKALSIYEQILNEDDTNAEAHWGALLCRYGIEYVEDPMTYKRVPTMNRAQYTSVLADEDYKAAIANADDYQREVYESEAKAIDEIQKGILAISQKEEPFDVFISFKETDVNGQRTPDAVLANDLYHQLSKEGFKVFFAPITLEDKLGSEYEPYIFAALNSAKVMVALGTKLEYFTAPWVKNEWSRYLTLIKNGADKTLVPAYKDMDPYDLPEEFSHLMAQDMSKLGFMQDLIRGVKKIVNTDSKESAKAEASNYAQGTSAGNIASLLGRGFMALEDEEWDEADDFFEQVLNQDFKNAQAYLGKLMADLEVSEKEDLEYEFEPFDDNSNYQKVLRFADEKLARELNRYVEIIQKRNEKARLEELYNNAKKQMDEATSEDAYKRAAQIFQKIHEHKDAKKLAEECLEKAEICRMDAIYTSGKSQMTGDTISSYEAAIKAFQSIPGWKDADNQIANCQRKIKELEVKAEAERLDAERQAEEKRITDEKAAIKRKKIITIAASAICACIAVVLVIAKVIIPNSKYNAVVALMNEGKYAEAITAFEAMNGYKDSVEKIATCQISITDLEYEKAISLMNDEQYTEAISVFEAINGYKDSAEQIIECHYKTAVALMNEGKYTEAIATFERMNGYKDSIEQITECHYKTAVALMNEGKNTEAIAVFEMVNGYKDSETYIDNFYIGKYGEEKGNKINNIKIGDIYSFGTYEQDNDKTNGKEVIEWQVLAKKDDKILIISDKALYPMPYIPLMGELLWKTCTLRKWLNDAFINEAFNSEEQDRVQSSTVTSIQNPEYKTTSTEDKVFLLSYNEAEKYFDSDEARRCVPTAYAKANGACYNKNYAKDGESTCKWWLRSNDDYPNRTVFVDFDGDIGFDAYDSFNYHDCVRPALWIKIE